MTKPSKLRQSEAALQKSLIRDLSRRGVKAIRQFAEVGIPDLLLIVPPRGVHMWVELKADGGTVSAGQRAYHADLLQLNARVRVVRGRQGVSDLLHEIDALMGRGA